MFAKKEDEVVKRTKIPITQNSLIEDFKKLGLKAGDIVIVHSSMSKIGWIAGTSVAVVNALMEVLSPEGTLVMPTMTSDNTDPENWKNPPVPDDWKQTIRDNMPAYHPDYSTSRGMGRISETFRSYPSVLRSNHPQSSFVAWGKYKEEICSQHDLTPCFGENSPLEKLYNLKAKILLLGVDHGNNTSLHYAECKANIGDKPIQKQGAALFDKGKRVWVSFEDLDYNDEDFPKLGSEFEKEYPILKGKIGQADSKLLPMKDLIDFAIVWFEKNRK
ncbi:MAG: aminoglycoside N(3)-acetyltransferase [Candidatus Heimdallarchaeaceae archaeon]